MKKYRIEIFVGSVFSSLLVLMLWNKLAIDSFPKLPWICLALTLLPIMALLSVSVVKREGDAEQYAPKFYAQMFLSSVVGIVIAVAVAAVLNRDNFSKTIDVTEKKVHSLSEESVKVLKGLDKKIEIVCIPELAQRSQYCEENTHLLTLFAQTNPEKIAVATVGASNIAALKRIAPTGDKRLVIATEGNRSEIVGQVTESKLTNGIIGLTKGKKVVYFLTGHGEPGIGWEGERSYATLVEFLKKRGYEAKEHKANTGDLPADAQVVVAGSPLQPYPPFVEMMLRRFLAKGGKLILSVNPYRDLGLSGLLSEVGVSLDPSVLVGDGGQSQQGALLAQANPMRPPVAIGEFSKMSDITSKLSLPYGVSDGARSITVAVKEAPVKVKSTELVSAFAAMTVPLSEGERNKISMEGPFALKGDYQPGKTFKVGYSLEIDNAEKLAEGIPAAAGADANAKPATAVKAQIALFGFELQSKYMDPQVSSQTEIPLLAVAELYKDKDLVTIPTKDYAPKAFRMDKNPQSWLPVFAFFLPAGTVLMGLYIWLRRRSS
jgi:hypothetical protein